MTYDLQAISRAPESLVTYSMDKVREIRNEAYERCTRQDSDGETVFDYSNFCYNVHVAAVDEILRGVEIVSQAISCTISEAPAHLQGARAEKNSTTGIKRDRENPGEENTRKTKTRTQQSQG
jgi:hypothetical protein